MPLAARKPGRSFGEMPNIAATLLGRSPGREWYTKVRPPSSVVKSGASAALAPARKSTLAAATMDVIRSRSRI